MKYYINTNKEIFAYEEDGSQDYLIGDKVAITQEEIDAINKAKEDEYKSTPEYIAQEAKRLRAEAMLNGFEYNGYMISVTSSDGNGMLQVKAGFELGITETIIHFENGTKLPMKAEDFSNFSLLFISERSKFFNEN